MVRPRAVSPRHRTSTRLLSHGSRWALGLWAFLLALFSSQATRAVTDTWVGNTSANWNDINWTGGNNPPALSGDALNFGIVGTSGLTLNNDFSGLSVVSITFAAGASAYTIGGNQFTVNTSIVNSSSSTQDFTAPISLGNAATLTSNNTGGNLTFDGVISNTVAHSMTINGGGTVTLNGANTYGAGLNTTLNGGTTLVLGNDNALGSSILLLSSSSGAGTVVASATRTIANNITLNNTSVTGTIGGSNAITFTGTVGTNTAAASGTLTVNNSAATAFSGNWVLTSGAQAAYNATINGTGNVAISGIISNGSGAGVGSLTHTGSGTLTLSGANTYSGTTTLGGGQLNLNNGGSGGASSALGTSALTITGTSTIDNTSGAAVTLSTNNAVTFNNATITFGGSSDLNFGTGVVTWAQNGQTINLGGTNSHLTFGGVMTSTHSSSNEALTVNGAGNTLTLGGFTTGGSHTTGKIFIVNGSGNVVINGQINNGVESSLGLTYSGTGSLTLAGNNTYTGATTLSSGAIYVNSSTAFGAASSVVAMNGPTFDNTSGAAITLANNNAMTWGNNNTFIGTNDLNLGTGAATLTGNRTWTVNGGTLTVGGAIGQSSAGFGLTKAGAGTMVLAGNNTFTGGLTATGGTLILSGTNTNTAATTITNATLTVDFSNVSAGTNVLSSASQLAFGSTNTASTQVVNLRGKDSTADTQTVNGINLFGGGAQGGGATHVFLTTSGSGGSMTLAMGSFANASREIGAALDFNLPANTFVTTTETVTTDLMMGQNVTVNGNDFATVSGGNVVGLSTVAGGYASVANGATTLTSAKVNDLAAGNESTNSLTVASLRFNDGSGNTTLTVNSSKTLTISGASGRSSAILVTSAVGAHTVKITGGTITGLNSRDLAVIQNNTAGILEIDSVIADASTNTGLTKSGLGTLLLTGVNTYTNATYIDEGMVIADGASNALGTNSGTAAAANLINIAGGATLQIGNNDSGGNLSTGTVIKPTVINDNGSVVFNRADSGLALSIVIAGTGSVTQSGTGTVALTAANTYTGATNITSGNLQVGASGIGQTGTGATIVNGSTAVLSGTGAVQGAATVTLGSIRPGDSGGASVGTLNFSNGLTFNPTGSTTVASLNIGPTTGVGDRIHITGNLTLNSSSNFIVTLDPTYTVDAGDSWTLMDWTGSLLANGFSTDANLALPDLSTFTGYAGQSWQVTNVNNGSFNELDITVVAAVPEPSRAVLLLLGCVGLVMRRRRAR